MIKYHCFVYVVVPYVVVRLLILAAQRQPNSAQWLLDHDAPIESVLCFQIWLSVCLTIIPLASYHFWYCVQLLQAIADSRPAIVEQERQRALEFDGPRVEAIDPRQRWRDEQAAIYEAWWYGNVVCNQYMVRLVNGWSAAFSIGMVSLGLSFSNAMRATAEEMQAGKRPGEADQSFWMWYLSFWLVPSAWLPMAHMFVGLSVYLTLLGGELRRAEKWYLWRASDVLRNVGFEQVCFAVHVVLNGVWMWLLYSFEELYWASMVLALLAVFSFLVAVRMSMTDMLVGLLYAPFICWVSYAASMTYDRWAMLQENGGGAV